MFTTTPPVPDNYAPLLLKPVLDGLAAKTKPTEVGCDEFPVFASDPLAACHRVLSRFIVDAESKYELGNRRAFKVRSVDGADEMLDSDEAGRFNYILAVICRQLWYWKRAVRKVDKEEFCVAGWRIESDFRLLPLIPLTQTLWRKLEGPVSQEWLLKLIDARLIERVGSELNEHVPMTKLVPVILTTAARDGAEGAMRKAIQRVRKYVAPAHYESGAYARTKKELVEQLDGILNPTTQKPKPTIIELGEPWANAVLEALDGNPTVAAKWNAILEHTADSDASQPSQKWQKTATQLVEAIGIGVFEQSLVIWFDLMLKPREVPLTEDQLQAIAFSHPHQTADIYSRKNETVMKGLAWIAGALDRPALASGLGALAERCYKKIPQIGPRAPKVGNGCLVALAMMTSPAAAAQLSRLKAIVKQPTGRKMIEKALSRMAVKQNVTVDDLEEQTVPTYGLKDGATERKIGKTKLTITLTPLAEIEQTWTIDGKQRKSPPADLKTKHPAELKTIKKELTDLDKTLTAQRLRVERLLLRQSDWGLDKWKSAYHEHPLVQSIARRLIWSFNTSAKTAPVAAIWDGKRFVDSADKPVKFDPKQTRVRLWHPSVASPDEVLAWRRWLENHEITQPFKQAHREIYLLTDAERRTDTYSNRFAQHILRQHQFQALCQQRGWKYQLMGGFDFHNTPTLEIPARNARVEFWVDVSEDGGITASGIATHLTTDKVQFLDPKTGSPLHLRDVPPLLLSEVFRDVDLFVGVTSVGNDPTWHDQVDQTRYHTYWHGYGLADLTESGKTRRQVLESLLPRLTKLHDKWRLDEKFLVIRGSLRTYKIHLGSGNILMEPNDQYLCIVPDRGGRDRVFLPFEGDTTLSVILSKAFMLAEDEKIDDISITRQIKEI